VSGRLSNGEGALKSLSMVVWSLNPKGTGKECWMNR
jgi:putative transposase